MPKRYTILTNFKTIFSFRTEAEQFGETVRILNEQEEKEFESQLQLLQECEKIRLFEFYGFEWAKYPPTTSLLTVIKAYIEAQKNSEEK